MSNPTTTAAPLNREAWLHAVAEKLWPMVTAQGGKKPESFRVSCGWPSRSALRRANSKSRRIGEAWHSGSEDGTREVFVSPALAHPVEVADVLLHELIHAALPPETGHRAPFPQIAKKLGLEGKPTATFAGEELAATLAEITAEVGAYPHAKLDATPHQKQGTRMLKVWCDVCGYTLRTTRTWLEIGTPICPCGSTMVSDYMGAAEGEPLTLAASHIEYKTADGRFTIRTTREGKREGAWIVVDHEGEVLSSREVMDPETGAVREIVTHGDRSTARRTKADALAFMQALRDGEVTWADVERPELDEEDVDLEEEDDDDDDLLGDYLMDDEEEIADFEDDLAEAEKPMTDEEYEAMRALREEGGRRTSEKIAAGEIDPLD